MPVVQRAEIDPAARELLRPHLAPGEALTWAGFPAKARFTKGSWGLMLFAVPWTAFALFWEGGVLLTGEGVEKYVMAAFGLPFVLIGLWMLSAPFTSLRAARRIVYGATAERLLIADVGKTPLVRAYGPADLAQVRRENEADGLLDVYFAVDADVARLMPPAGGKGQTSLGKVGFIGVPPAAAAAVEAVRARKAAGAPSGPLPPEPSAEPGLAFEARGAVEACRVKLQGALAERKARQARRHATWMNRFWMIAAPVLVAPPVIGFASEGLAGAFFGLFASLFLAIFAGIGFAIMKSKAATEAADASRLDALLGLLEGWKADAHPKARLTMKLDLGPATGVRPYRFANSPSSGTLKTWHRHRWARFVWATACGSPVVVELVDKVKYKGGSEVERHGLVRGWVVPNAAVWGDSGMDASFKAGPLRVAPLEIEGRRVLAFRGEVADAAAAARALRDLYHLLEQRSRRVRG